MITVNDECGLGRL